MLPAILVLPLSIKRKHHAVLLSQALFWILQNIFKAAMSGRELKQRRCYLASRCSGFHGRKYNLPSSPAKWVKYPFLLVKIQDVFHYYIYNLDSKWGNVLLVENKTKKSKPTSLFWDWYPNQGPFIEITWTPCTEVPCGSSVSKWAP